MDANRRPGRSDLRQGPENRARSCEQHVRTTTEGTGDGSGTGTGAGPARRAGRPDHRFVARPALAPHLQRRAAGRTGGRRGGLDRGGRERSLRRARCSTWTWWPCAAAGAIRTTWTWPRPPPPGSPCCGPRDGTPTPWPSWPWACSSPPPAAWWRPTPTCATARSTRTAPSPTSASGPGSSPGAPPAWSAWVRWGGRCKWRLRGLGIEVIAYDPYADEPTVSLEELLARADVVSMHAPVTPETTGMIGAEQFASMRDGVVFLNTARAAAPRHRRTGRGAAVGQGVGRRARPLRRASPWPSTTR